MDYYSRARDFLTGSIADIQIYQDVMAKSRAIPSKPDAKIQVLGAGFSRTATLSMYSAMLELGYKCYHGIEFECALGVADRWIKVLEHDLKPGSTKGIDWTEVTRGYEAGFDAPFAVSAWPIPALAAESPVEIDCSHRRTTGSNSVKYTLTQSSSIPIATVTNGWRAIVQQS